MELLEIEQDFSTQFYTAYLNNTRAMIKLFDAMWVLPAVRLAAGWPAIAAVAACRGPAELSGA